MVMPVWRPAPNNVGPSMGDPAPVNNTLSGALYFVPDNTYDIGASGATRPRSIYVGQSIFCNGLIQIGAGSPFGFVTGSSLYSGTGVPNNGNGNNGDYYFRSDTPATANQRLYIKSAGAWVGII